MVGVTAGIAISSDTDLTGGRCQALGAAEFIAEDGVERVFDVAIGIDTQELEREQLRDADGGGVAALKGEGGWERDGSGEVHAINSGTELAMRIFIEAKPKAGHVDAGAAEEPVGADLCETILLFGKAEVAEAKNRANEELRGAFFKDGDDGPVLGASDIDSKKEAALSFRAVEEFESFTGPLILANETDVLRFGLGDQIVGEQGHVFGGEGAFVVLVVGDFVDGKLAGFGGSDYVARERVKDLQALFAGD